ncbi:flagellar hook assembly protein FlgD [Rhizobium sp. BE258]|uniref:flagellar hook assembly protein FlgD n=1 Tax=Rhizobium sp. BE258 TaxID=2817722 RepID=UPI000DD832C8|nr:flagellar hook assembly protein FlgD [Rhizobium sp. BE258]MDR7145046.1 flagellar basal-body rod modification protein FlgD [Rhizobium sp. BE258]
MTVVGQVNKAAASTTNGTGNTGNTTDPTSQAGSKTASDKAMLNYDSFLQLLIAQLKNQDPTAPSDPAQQLAQLASFSQVEQTIQSNQKLDSLLTQSSLQIAQSYIGKYVQTSGDNPVSGTVASVKVYSDGLIATLDNGKQVLVGPGVTISDAPPKTNTPS